ncbi:hypothetical protein CMO90_01205 [Candidatus Woesearchaeota archaeon]|jgi:molybdopterin/thiamine biosynthesis adenylyltransferase|nr:hypothetical protein [Candidatus Woesearchaeota archaeon]|tara:strand:- start:509 stop:1168 length:660 start_codon:yes stop_codon:yes gene_type:complete
MNRYEFQELFEEIGEKSSELRKKIVMIIGSGSLGSTVSDMLHREGVPLKIVDKGRSEIKDLQHQSLYLEEDDNKFKVKQIKKRLEPINTKNKIRTFHEDLVEDNLFLLDSVDIIIDCSNDLETMKMVGNYVKKKTQLINCKYAGSKGTIFISNRKHYFKDVVEKIKIGDINKEGLINSTVHLAAGIIVSQALKILVGEKITDNFILFDVWKDSVRRISI